MAKVHWLLFGLLISMVGTTCQAQCVSSIPPINVTGILSVCNGSSTSLTVGGGTLGTGAQWKWYTGSCGGTLIDSGAVITVSPTTTKAYWVRAEGGSCSSTTACATATVTVNAVPAAPTKSIDDSTVCRGVAAGLRGYSVGNTIFWFKQSSGGTAVDSTASHSYYTPVMDTSVVYYLEAKSSAGCVSAARTALSVTALPVPAAPTAPTSNSPNCGQVTLTRVGTPPTGQTWYFGPAFNMTIHNGNHGSTYVVTTSGTYYIHSRYDTTGCWGLDTVTINVEVKPRPAAPDSIYSNSPQCQGTGVTLTVVGSAPAGQTWYWQPRTVRYYTTDTGATYTVGSTSVPCIKSLDTVGCWSDDKCIGATVNPRPAAPTAATPSTATSVCSAANLSISATSTGNSIDWYTQSTGGSLLGSSASGTGFTVNPSTGGAFYAASRSAEGCVSSSRKATGVLSILSLPAAPSAPGLQSVCSDTAYTFVFDSVLAGSGGNQIEWSRYSSFDSSTIVSNGSDIYLTVTVGSTDTLWMRSRVSSTGCSSASVATTLQVHENPATPISDLYAAGLSSDTGMLVTLDSVFLGSGGDQLVWATNSNFVDSQIAASGHEVSVFLNPGERDTVWLKTRSSYTSCNSSVVYTILQLDTLVDDHMKNVDWEIFYTTYEADSHQLVCTHTFDMNSEVKNIFPSYAIASNELEYDSVGTVSFDINQGGSFAGGLGMISNPSSSDGLFVAGVILMPNAFQMMDSTTESGIYAIVVDNMDTVEPIFEYLGEYTDGVPLNIKIRKEGDTLTFIKNGVSSITKVFTQHHSERMYPGVIPFIENTVVDRVMCDFESPLVLSAQTNHLSCGDTTLGRVSVSVKGGKFPYHYSWSTGDTTSSIENLSPGYYALTVTDIDGNVDSTFVNIAYAITWDTTRGVTIDTQGVIYALSAIENENVAGVCLGKNTLNAGHGEVGWVEYKLPKGVHMDFLGIIDSVDFENGETSPNGVTLLLLQNTLTIGFNFDFENGEFIGYLNPMEDNLIRIEKFKEDSVRILVNGVNRYETRYVYPEFIRPIVGMAYEFDKILSVSSSFCGIGAEENALRAQVKVYPASGVSSTGTVEVFAQHGNPPYIYHWSTGDSTSILTDVAFGTYQVSVTDQMGESVVRSAFMGAYADWDMFYNTHETDSHQLVCTYTFDLNSEQKNVFPNYGIASNELKADSNGTVSFDIWKGGAYTGALGLISNPAISEELYAAAVILVPNQVQLFDSSMESGIYAALLESGENSEPNFEYIGQYVDSVPLNITIQKSGDTVCFYKNGLSSITRVFRQHHTGSMYLGTIPFFENTQVDRTLCNFGSPLSIRGEVSNISCDEDTLGKIRVRVKGGKPPYQYLWATSDTTSELTSLSVGEYTVTVTDQNNTSSTAYFSVGHRMEWDTLVQVTVDPVGTVKTDTGSLGDIAGYGIASNTLFSGESENGWVDFKLRRGIHGAVFGLISHLDFNHSEGEESLGLGLMVNLNEIWLASDFGFDRGTYLGAINPLMDNLFRLEKFAGDSLRVILNGKILLEEHCDFPYYIKPFVLIMLENDQVDFVASSFCNQGNDSLAYAGLLTSSSDSICRGESVVLRLKNYAGVINWEEKDGLSWDTISGIHSDSLKQINIQSITQFRAIVSRFEMSYDTTEIVTIHVKNQQTGLDRIHVGTSLCETPDSLTLKSIFANSNTASYQWQYSENGIEYTNITGAFTEDYYITNPTHVDRWFRRYRIDNFGCSNLSNAVKVKLYK